MFHLLFSPAVVPPDLLTGLLFYPSGPPYVLTKTTELSFDVLLTYVTSSTAGSEPIKPEDEHKLCVDVLRSLLMTAAAASHRMCWIQKVACWAPPPPSGLGEFVQ